MKIVLLAVFIANPALHAADTRHFSGEALLTSGTGFLPLLEMRRVLFSREINEKTKHHAFKTWMEGHAEPILSLEGTAVSVETKASGGGLDAKLTLLNFPTADVWGQLFKIDQGKESSIFGKELLYGEQLSGTAIIEPANKEDKINVSYKVRGITAKEFELQKRLQSSPDFADIREDTRQAYHDVAKNFTVRQFNCIFKEPSGRAGYSIISTVIYPGDLVVLRFLALNGTGVREETALLRKVLRTGEYVSINDSSFTRVVLKPLTGSRRLKDGWQAVLTAKDPSKSRIEIISAGADGETCVRRTAVKIEDIAKNNIETSKGYIFEAKRLMQYAVARLNGTDLVQKRLNEKSTAPGAKNIFCVSNEHKKNESDFFNPGRLAARFLILPAEKQILMLNPSNKYDYDTVVYQEVDKSPFLKRLGASDRFSDWLAVNRDFNWTNALTHVEFDVYNFDHVDLYRSSSKRVSWNFDDKTCQYKADPRRLDLQHIEDRYSITAQQASPQQYAAALDEFKNAPALKK